MAATAGRLFTLTAKTELLLQITEIHQVKLSNDQKHLANDSVTTTREAISHTNKKQQISALRFLHYTLFSNSLPTLPSMWFTDLLSIIFKFICPPLSFSRLSCMRVSLLPTTRLAVEDSDRIRRWFQFQTNRDFDTWAKTCIYPIKNSLLPSLSLAIISTHQINKRTCA